MGRRYDEGGGKWKEGVEWVGPSVDDRYGYGCGWMDMDERSTCLMRK